MSNETDEWVSIWKEVIEAYFIALFHLTKTEEHHEKLDSKPVPSGCKYSVFPPHQPVSGPISCEITDIFGVYE